METASRQPVIRVKNVTQRFRLIHERPDTLREFATKYFRKREQIELFEAVKNVSFDVYPGDMLGIVGANGSGKSTLLKAIAGVYKPSEGSVEIHGSLAPMIELGAGFHPELTGRENIMLNGLLLGFSRKQMIEREGAIMDFADIGHFIDVPVKQYSSGMMARLAFAVSAEIDPDILVVDEVLAVGDAAFQIKCAERLERFRRSKKTMLFVSHAMPAVKQLCNRAILLEHGRMIMDGTPDEIFDRYIASVTQVESALPSSDLVLHGRA